MPELQTPLRLVRAEDLLVLEVDVVNLVLSDDGRRLERAEPDTAAHLIVRFPSQHVGEQAFFESSSGSVVPDPPPVGALAAGTSRLVFTLPDDRADVPFTAEGLLDWSGLVPRLAPNALPAGATEGPAPALPADDQTAIELPYRLLLSPDAGGRWHHRSQPFAEGGRTELWHTRLSPERRTNPVRAIARRPVPDALRTSLSASDLDDLVTLTSDFTIRPKSADELLVSPGLWLQLMQVTGLLGFHWAPRPLDAERLVLSALGGSVRMRGAWDYPPPDRPLDQLRRFGMPTPSLQQYEHVAGQGRDQFVRVVRRGFVHCGHRASLVKITERRFEPRQLGTGQGPTGPFGIFGATAYLRQYFQVVLQEPVLDYGPLAPGYPSGGYEMPLRTLRFTTLTSPKIDLPAGADPVRLEAGIRALWELRDPGRPIDEVALQEAVQRTLEDRLQEPFWVTAGGADHEFSFTATDWEGRPVSGSTPLLFVPQEAVEDTSQVVAEFGAGPATRRRRPLHGQPLALADPTGSAPGTTVTPVETLSFELRATVPGAELPPLYRPRWVMAVADADVRVEAVERLTGSAAARRVTFAPAYLARGLDSTGNPAGVFAALASAVDIAFGGAGGGGVARPDAAVKLLSSRQGVMPEAFATAEVDVGQLTALFGKAKLLGSVALSDILAPVLELGPSDFGVTDLPDAALEQLLADPARKLRVPALRTRRIEHQGRPAVEARYVWKPALKSGPLLDFGEDAEFVLDVRTITPLDGSAPVTSVRGELRHFSIKFFGVIRVQVQRLAFAALNGRKPDIAAHGLDVEFLGPLEFVSSLRNVLPADAFGKAPAITVGPSGIKAGLSLGIPSVGIGVFSLQNLALAAALSVPFTDAPAGLRLGLSERQNPFLVTVTLFGGGGFFALAVSTKGVEEIEAAIEFGGNVALNLGVASGGVYVMAGVYFSLKAKETSLTGYLRCGGYLSVLGLISISVEFYLGFTFRAKDPGGCEIYGQARVTVCVKVLFISKSVSLSIERRFAGASGDPTLEQVVDADDWEQYCLAFAAEDAA